MGTSQIPNPQHITLCVILYEEWASSEKGAFAGSVRPYLPVFARLGFRLSMTSAQGVPPLGGRGHQVHICRTAGKFFLGGTSKSSWIILWRGNLHNIFCEGVATQVFFKGVGLLQTGTSIVLQQTILEVEVGAEAE